ncbi:hypothetical protein BGW80DRAFT_1372100 [Lactifluus volemus]|nr:hypothetical protein BGW80DRAFT_1372100 [Lactifluus volemus]
MLTAEHPMCCCILLALFQVCWCWSTGSSSTLALQRVSTPLRCFCAHATGISSCNLDPSLDTPHTRPRPRQLEDAGSGGGESGV